MYRMIETNDYQGLSELFYRNGLEITPGDMPPDGLIQCWEVIKEETAERVAGIVLEKRCGEFVVGDISVEKPERKQGLGILMMEKVIAEVMSMGGDKIMLVAKAPEFFRKMGFTSIDRQTAPDISKCMTCKQFDVDCFPEVMVLYF